MGYFGLVDDRLGSSFFEGEVFVEVSELRERALRVREGYRRLNERRGDKPWGISEFMAGLVGDVGDLSELIMAHQGYRPAAQLDEALPHELADCLWSLLIISDIAG